MRSRASGRKLTGRSLTDLAASRIAMAYLDEPRPQRKRNFSHGLAAPSDAKRVETPFLSPFGIRSLSRFHRDHPFRFHVGERTYFVGYHPAESESGSFGGNSNWRGSVWMPMNPLIVRALLNLYRYGEGFTIDKSLLHS